MIGYGALDSEEIFTHKHCNDNKLEGLFLMKGIEKTVGQDYIIISPNKDSDIHINSCKITENGIEIDNIIYDYNKFSITCKWRNNNLVSYLIRDSDQFIVWTLPNEVIKFLEFDKFKLKICLGFTEDNLMIKELKIPNSNNPIPISISEKLVKLNNTEKLGRVTLNIEGSSDRERILKSHFVIDGESYLISKCFMKIEKNRILIMSSWKVNNIDTENVAVTLGYVEI